VFLKLFEQAGRPDGLPLKDNKFRVDNTIREATILLFRTDGAAEPTLTSPSGQTFGREQAPPFVSWHRDTGYDLITLRDPEAGEWALSADMDPDNRVMVVTDLKLQVSELPSRIAVGDVLPVAANLANDGRLITRRAFLDLVEMRAETQGDAGLAPWPLNDKGYKGDQAPDDGVYSMNLVEAQPHQRLELVVAAESPTFLRERRQLLQVLEPASLALLETDADTLAARVVITDAVMRDDGLSVGVWQQATDGAKRKLELSRQEDGGYQATLVERGLPVYARVEGTSKLGTAVAREYGPLYAPGVAAPAEPEPAVEAVAEPAEPEPVQPVEESTAPEEVPPAAKAEDEAAGWLVPTIAFVGVNLLLVIAGGVFWWLRRRAGGDDDEIDLLLEDEDPEAATEKNGESADQPGAEAEGQEHK
jgi:uncharacterized protein (TIGR03503 family)